MSLTRAESAARQAHLGDVQLVAAGQPDYPHPLETIADPPALLHVRGALGMIDPAIAIVGARRATPEGRRLARTLASSLAQLGYVIVSGLARGIDGEAHRGALDAGGRTIAVLGSGVDVIYPPEHRTLASDVAASGAVVSEFPLGARPTKHNFPIRNQTIAGLSRAIIVVEAAERSGSLITARLATDEGRAVLAVPGSPLSEQHRGTNRLIQQGATLLQGIEDVIDELPRGLRAKVVTTVNAADPLPAPDGVAGRIYDYLSPTEPKHVDEILAALKLDGREAAVLLVELELQERIARLAGSRYVRLRTLTSSGAA